MSNPVPSSLALTAIADESPRTAAPVRNNFSAIQTAVNALITILGGGTVGQVMQAVDASDVQWASQFSAQKVAWAGIPAGEATGFPGWLTANAAILVPFTCQVAQTISALNVRAGATQSGHFDVGVYTVAGTSKILKGSTLQSTLSASATNSVAVTPTVLDPGEYWLALAADNTTGTFAFDSASGPYGVYERQVATSFPLPASITPGSTNPARALMLSAALA